MLRVFLVFLSLRLFFPLPAALACPSLYSLIAWCAPWSTRGDRRSVSVADKRLAPRSMCPLAGGCLQLIDANVYVGTASWGGEVLFHLAPIVFFSPYSILLGVVHSHCVQLHKRGVGTLCAVFRGRIGPSTKPRTMPGRATSGCRRDGRKHGGNCTETGSFSHRPPRSSSSGEHVACRRTVPSPCAGGGGKTRPRKRQMQGKNVICNDLCAKSACISKKKPTFAVELSYYYCQPHHAKKITSFLHGAAHLGGGAHGGRPPQAQ